MAQRNPMNQRYQGDGPGGQTRKSAARAKPVSQAAATVHIKKKPQTDSEKRAARKAREKEEERKAIERAKRKAEREQAEGEQSEGDAAESEQPKGFLGKLLAPAPNMPASVEYRKWRKRYWILLGIGIVCVAISFIYQMSGGTNQTFWMISIGAAYAVIIGAFIVDFRKVRPLIKEHQKQGTGGKTPKQLKHEQEAKERAEAIEAARKAAQAAKKASRRRKPKDTIVPADADDAATATATDAAASSDSDTVAPEKD
ncbi:MAG: hypothetical protein LBH64_00770 [Coriobacteriales bacterium]|jgi:hypothetical protein|nr:hypothetical protein [Coriobacteriales bacterium]